MVVKLFTAKGYKYCGVLEKETKTHYIIFDTLKNIRAHVPKIGTTLEEYEDEK